MDDVLKAQWAAVFRTEPEHVRYPMRSMVSDVDELRARTLDVAMGLLDAPDAEVAERCRRLIDVVDALDHRVREIHQAFAREGRW